MDIYANGAIPTSALSRLSVGGFLLPAAANNFELWRTHAAKDGYNLTITSSADAFRTYAIQERIFRERYTTTYLAGRPIKRWNGVTWWLKPGQSTAAVPGTSNHGRGVAVDVKNAGGFNGKFYRWMASTGPALGWTNTEGAAINEPWHWVNDNRARGAIGTLPGAIPDQKDDDMSAQDIAVLRADMNTLHTLLNEILNATGVLYRDVPALTAATIVPAIVDGVLNTQIPRANGSGTTTSLAAIVSHYDFHMGELLGRPVQGPSGVDQEALTKAVTDRVGEILAGLSATVHLEAKDAPA